MVERLKEATAKARERRLQRTGSGLDAPADSQSRDKLWSELEEVSVETDWMDSARIVSFEKKNPIHAEFDLLRTNVLKIMRDNGWRSIGITSPTPGCGKTLVSTNLAFSLARNPGLRTLVMDLDLRAPQLAQRLNQTAPHSLAAFLQGRVSIEDYFVRVGDNLAFGFNSSYIFNAAELIQDPNTEFALSKMLGSMNPDVAIYDLPPLFGGDDTLNALRNVDCMLLVIASGQTTPEQIEECERMVRDGPSFVGVVLNKSEPSSSGQNAGSYYSNKYASI